MIGVLDPLMIGEKMLNTEGLRSTRLIMPRWRSLQIFTNLLKV